MQRVTRMYNYYKDRSQSLVLEKSALHRENALVKELTNYTPGKRNVSTYGGYHMALARNYGNAGALVALDFNRVRSRAGVAFESFPRQHNSDQLPNQLGRYVEKPQLRELSVQRRMPSGLLFGDLTSVRAVAVRAAARIPKLS